MNYKECVIENVMSSPPGEETRWGKSVLLSIFFFSLFTFFSPPAFAQSWLWGKQSFSYNSGQGDPYYGDHSLAVDISDNVYITGFFLGTLTFGPFTLVGDALNNNAYIVKYSSSGKPLWAKQSEGTAVGAAVATDNQANVFLTGYFGYSTAFGTDTLIALSVENVYLVKYDSSGNVLWARQAGIFGQGEGTSVTTDEKGNSYITGYFTGNITFGSFTLKSISEDYFLVKYDINGNVLWAKQSQTVIYGNATTTSMGIDNADNIFITGYIKDTTIIGTYHLKTNSLEDVFLAKYDSGGNVLWATQASYYSAGQGRSVTIDGANNAYVTGYFNDSLSIGANHFFAKKSGNVFLAKFNSAGNAIWAKVGESLTIHDWFGYSVTSDTLKRGGGYLLISSWVASSQGFIFGTDTFDLGNPNGVAVILLRFDSSGNTFNSSIFTVGSEDDYDGVAIDKSGCYIYIEGDILSNQEDTIIFGKDTLQDVGGNELPFVAQYSNCTEANFSAITTSAATCKNSCIGTATAIPKGGNAPYTYSWSNRSTTQSVTGLCPGTYTVIVTDSSGERTLQSVTITFPASDININPASDSICSGASVSITASGIRNYQWSPATGLSCFTCPNPVASPTTTVTYMVTGQDTNNYGCPDTATITIKVKPVPGILITPSISCQNRNTVLTASGATSYTWSPPAFLSCPNCAITDASPPVTTTYTITGISIGCVAVDSVSVIPFPAFLLNLTVPYDTICAGDTIPFMASGNNLKSYSWTPAAGLSCSNCPNPKAFPVANISYTLTAADSLGCDTVSVVTITIVKPVANISAVPDTICPGDSANLIASGGTHYLWSTSQTTESIWVKPTAITTYTVTAQTGGCVVSASLSVHVTPLPIPIISGPSSVCKDSSATLTASGGATYKWSNGETSATIGTGNITSNTTLTVTAYNGICFKDTTITITLSPMPKVDITKDTSICDGQSIALKASGGGTYLWSTSATTDTIVISPSTPTSYTVIVDSICIVTASVTISVNAAASMSVGNDTTIFTGDTAFIFAYGSKGTNKYLWTPNYNLSCDSCPITFAFPSQTTTYTVTGTNSAGCSINALVTVYVIPHCYDFIVPNVFTPNGDGVNDRLVVKELQQYEPVNYSDLAYTITIYDRWGKIMYKSSNPAESWDGNNMSGAKVPDGVYFYIITSSCQNNGQAFTYDKKGFVQLIR